jgi:nucleotide-binding universal stress UspA family protein
MNLARVLCPTDFSEASAHAIDHALALASRYHARIAALHVVESPVVTELGMSSGAQVDEPVIQRLRARIATCFSGAAAAGLPVDIHVEVGQPFRRILDDAVALCADLIVLGTHGASGLEHLVLGSVTEKVLRKAPCPVLTVPPRSLSGSRLPFQRVLCAVDFSEASLTALQYALAIAEDADATLTILHVLEWPWEEPPPPRLEDLPEEQGKALAEYRRYCETSASARLAALIPNSVRLSRPPVPRLMSGKPYAQILQVAGEESSDLIAIGVQGRNPLDMMLFGSTTNQIVRRAGCPVLTLRK